MLDIIKALTVKTLPDVLTQSELKQMLLATRKLRYRVFLLTSYSMGLWLGETLSLQVGDIDAQHHQVHIRRGKGHVDRLVPLSEITHCALQRLWRQHRNPCWLFPSAAGSMQQRIGVTKIEDRCQIVSFAILIGLVMTVSYFTIIQKTRPDTFFLTPFF